MDLGGPDKALELVKIKDRKRERHLEAIMQISFPVRASSRTLNQSKVSQPQFPSLKNGRDCVSTIICVEPAAQCQACRDLSSSLSTPLQVAIG